MAATWHPQCFTCEMCHKELADQGFIKNQGRALCHECNAKVGLDTLSTDMVIDIICHVDHWVCAGESSWKGAVHVPEMPLPHRGRAPQVPRRGKIIKNIDDTIEIISNISTAAVLLPVPLQLHGLRHRADEQRAGGEDAPRLHRAGAQRAVLPPLPRQDGHPHLRRLQETHRGGLVKIQSAEK